MFIPHVITYSQLLFQTSRIMRNVTFDWKVDNIHWFCDTCSTGQVISYYNLHLSSQVEHILSALKNDGSKLQSGHLFNSTRCNKGNKVLQQCVLLVICLGGGVWLTASFCCLQKSLTASRLSLARLSCSRCLSISSSVSSSISDCIVEKHKACGVFNKLAIWTFGNFPWPYPWLWQILHLHKHIDWWNSSPLLLNPFKLP